MRRRITNFLPSDVDQSGVYRSISGTAISQSWKRYGTRRNSLVITIYRRLTGYMSKRADGTADAYASCSYENQLWHLQSNPCSRVGRERALYRGNSRLRSLNPERSRVDHQRGSALGCRAEPRHGE